MIPSGMSEGEYKIVISVERRAYLQNRHLKDYFLNEDSYAGFIAGRLTIRK
jgi:hypothetical protein